MCCTHTSDPARSTIVRHPSWSIASDWYGLPRMESASIMARSKWRDLQWHTQKKEVHEVQKSLVGRRERERSSCSGWGVVCLCNLMTANFCRCACTGLHACGSVIVSCLERSHVLGERHGDDEDAVCAVGALIHGRGSHLAPPVTRCNQGVHLIWGHHGHLTGMGAWGNQALALVAAQAKACTPPPPPTHTHTLDHLHARHVAKLPPLPTSVHLSHRHPH